MSTFQQNNLGLELEKPKGILFPVEILLNIFHCLLDEYRSGSGKYEAASGLTALGCTCHLMQAEVEKKLYQKLIFDDNLERVASRFCRCVQSVVARPERALSICHISLTVDNHGRLTNEPDQSQDDSYPDGISLEDHNRELRLVLDDVNSPFTSTRDLQDIADSLLQLLGLKLPLEVSLNLTSLRISYPIFHSMHQGVLVSSSNREPIMERLGRLATLTILCNDSPLSDEDVVFFGRHMTSLTTFTLEKACTEKLPLIYNAIGKNLTTFKLQTRSIAIWSWPMDVLRFLAGCLPSLKHLTLDQSEQNFIENVRELEESNRLPTSTVELWKDACPALETFVWILCQRHHKLTATSRDGRYGKQLLALTHTLMDKWSTLKVSIRPGFQSLPLHESQRPGFYIDYMEYQRAHEGSLEEQTWQGDTLSTGLFESTETIFKPIPDQHIQEDIPLHIQRSSTLRERRLRPIPTRRE